MNLFGFNLTYNTKNIPGYNHCKDFLAYVTFDEKKQMQSLFKLVNKNKFSFYYY